MQLILDRYRVMARFGDAIRELLDREHLSQREFARKSGLSLSNVVRILKLDSATVNGTTYRTIAETFGMSTAELDRHWRPGMRRVVPADGIDRGIPILAEIPCGSPSDEQVSEARGYISRGAVQVDDAAAYCVVVTGDSMMPEFAEGELVICSPTVVHEVGFEDGKVYAFSIRDDGSTLKRCRLVDDESIELRADNPRHASRVVSLDDIVHAAKVLAKVVKYD